MIISIELKTEIYIMSACFSFQRKGNGGKHMLLPGKYCIGILEEDNPLKSYFRFKPILVAEEDRFVPFDTPEEYPSDGCIRIVPDKNESGLFKMRMRRIGLFAAVDLHAHPSESDKIRSNKNYHNDDSERNAYIIYSDVIREPTRGSLFSVLKISPEEAENALVHAQPLSDCLLYTGGALLGSVWHCASDPDIANGYRLEKTETEVDASALQVFDLALPDGQAITLAVRPISPMTITKADVLQPVEANPTAAPKEEAPQEPALPAESPDVASAVPIYRQILMEQCGLNPRRGRSLKEIVDEKWRTSRFEALGLLTQDVQNTKPAETPVESAMSAFRAVWAQPQLRTELVSALAEFEDLDNALNACKSAARESVIGQQLVDLEARRLESLRQLEEIRKDASALRESVKQEILQDEADAFADAIEKTQAARAQQAEMEKACEEIRSDAAAAQDLLNSLNDGRFEKRLQEFALTSRAASLIRRLDAKRVSPPVVNGVSVDRDALIERTCNVFELSGASISRADAVHMLICASQSPFLLFAGSPGCGKTRMARLLACALGLPDSRVHLISPGKDSVTIPDVSGTAMRIVVLDDANLSPVGDFYRGLSWEAESGKILLCATLQDDGLPVAAYAFDRAFTILLNEDTTIENFCTATRVQPEKYPPVSLSTLRTIFPMRGGCIPENVLARLRALIVDCKLIGLRPSARAANAILNLLNAEIPLQTAEPIELLDRAVSERMLPALLAGSPLDSLRALPKLLKDLPRCGELLSHPLPVRW